MIRHTCHDQTRAIADLPAAGERRAQQAVCEIPGLAPGRHCLNIINRGSGPVAVAAVIVR